MLGYKDIELKQTRFYQEVFAEGEAALLLRLLERRFGPLPEAVRARVETADADTLLVWGERLLTAPTLEEVFGD